MELVHVVNHSIDGRLLFYDKQDYGYFVHLLYEFNSDEYNTNAWRVRTKEMTNIRCSSLVQIHGWCLMKDHYHLLLSPVVDDGVSKFLRRLNNGYAKVYNARYDRSGFVFRGRTKKILVKTDAHLLYILHYIHCNPLDYTIYKKWRFRDGNQPVDVSKATDYLRGYRWSSYLDYCGKVNYPSVLTKEFFKGLFENYVRELTLFLRSSGNTATKDLVLE